jgi:acyl-CoA synthetase (AMP-forming)/AMP-acid ligase II
MKSEVMATVDRELGAIARPGAVHFVTLLPKTRSGKLLRRAIQALRRAATPAISPPSRTRPRWSRSGRARPDVRDNKRLAS